jgi:hypothetical protein
MPQPKRSTGTVLDSAIEQPRATDMVSHCPQLIEHRSWCALGGLVGFAPSIFGCSIFYNCAVSASHNFLSTTTRENDMLQTKDLASKRNATMSDVSDIAHDLTKSIASVLTATIDAALTAALDDPLRREAVHYAMLTTLPRVRDDFTKQESIFSALLAGEIYRALCHLRAFEVEPDENNTIQ